MLGTIITSFLALKEMKEPCPWSRLALPIHCTEIKQHKCK
jgi:hypothetical protein